MSIRYLGDSIDIHGGGADLIFPHHENEIAQSESFTGCTPFVKYWLHNGLLQLGDEKMSKSTGNLITIKELIANHDPNALRFFVLSSHYRRPATYTEASFAAAERGLSRLYAALRPLHNGVSPGSLDGDNELKEKAEVTRQKFEEAMDDDFNTAIALSALFELAKAINTAIDKNIVSPGFVEAQATLQELLRILGFNLNQHINQSQLENNNVAPFIELLLSIRSELRDEKQWAFADRIRDGLTELGIVLEDTAQGTKWRL